MSAVIALSMADVPISATIPCRFHEANALVHRWDGVCEQPAGARCRSSLGEKVTERRRGVRRARGYLVKSRWNRAFPYNGLNVGSSRSHAGVRSDE